MLTQVLQPGSGLRAKVAKQLAALTPNHDHFEARSVWKRWGYPGSDSLDVDEVDPKQNNGTAGDSELELE